MLRLRLQRLLASRGLPAVALGLAALLCLPALFAGPFGDDWVLQSRLRHGDGSLGAAADLYRFSLDPETFELARGGGLVPWFTDPALKLELLRPLSSLLFAGDLRAFGGLGVPAHLHSLLWFLACVCGAWLCLRRALPGAVGALALLLFAVDESHWMAIGWLANRHALVATAPVLLGLAAWMRWREERWRPGLGLALLGFTAGLLGGETAVQALAYVFAYELIAAPEQGRAPAAPPRRRALAIAPVAALTGGYLLLYRGLGYGAHAHDQYLDPFAAPVATLSALAERVPPLLGDLLGGMPSDLWAFFPAQQPLLIAIGLAVVLAVALLLRAAWPSLLPAEARGVRWLALGGFFSLLPGGLGPVGSRLLLVSSLGSAALVAAILVRGGERLASAGLSRAGQRLLRAGLWWLVWVHAVAAPLLLPALLVNFGLLARATAAISRDAEVPFTKGAPPDVLVLAVPDLAAMLYPPILAELEGRPRHRGWWQLSMARADHALVRTGADSFTLQAIGARLHQGEHERFFRSRGAALRPGAKVTLPGLEIEVVSQDTLSVRSARPLDDPGLAILSYQGGRLRKVVLPTIGGRLLLPRERGPMGL